MSLGDRTPTPGGKPGRKFRVLEVLAELDEHERAVLEGWLRDLSLSPEKIRDELVAEGHSITAGAIAHYRYEALGLGNRKR